LKRRQEGVEFAYDGEKGPARWSELSKDFELCSTGKVQSPIDFPGTAFLAPENPPPATFDWKTTKDLEFVNEGVTIKVVMPNKDSTTTHQGIKFTLEQFHFHDPSEHRLDGQNTNIEMHFVHSDANGNIHVTGVLLDMFAQGSDGNTKNEFLEQIIPNIPGANKGDKKTIAEVDFQPLLDILNKSRFNTYTGSLTTPPCAEGLKWVVTAEAIPLSVEQFAAISKAVSFNSRFVQ
ncbi:putative carbonic anhydrase, partial [Cladochytrium replicatum]